MIFYASNFLPEEKEVEKSSGKVFNDGFTLIELVIVVVIMALMFTVGTVNLREFQRRSALEGIVENIRSDLHLLREHSLSGDRGLCADRDGDGEFVDDYRWVIENSSNPAIYRLTIWCLNPPRRSSDIKTVTLPDNYELTTDGGQPRFEPLGGGLENNNSITINVTNTATGESKSVVVNTSGVIE